ncbi:MAG: hypothetical protein ACI83O_000976 [Patescibacteria group bacterium]
MCDISLDFTYSKLFIGGLVENFMVNAKKQDFDLEENGDEEEAMAPLYDEAEARMILGI